MEEAEDSLIETIQQNPVSSDHEFARKHRSKVSKVLLFVFLALIIALGYAGYNYYLSSNLSTSFRWSSELRRANKTQNVIPSPSIDPTANWKTYTNTKYRFSLKYPEDFIEKIDNSEKGTLSKGTVDPKCVVGCTPSPGISINVVNNPKNLSAEKFALPDIDLHTDNLKKYKGSDLQSIFNSVMPISSVFAVRFSGIQCGHSSAFYIKHEDKIIELNILCDEDFDNLDQILSTFKFLD